MACALAKLSYQNGLYNLSKNERCYIFSDEEGYSPFGDDTHIDRFGNDLQFKDTDKKRKIIADIKDDVKLVFLGDLVDNGKSSIRLLQSMIRLKNKNPSQVILIGGNRDYNKIRMYDEYLILEDDHELDLNKVFDMNNEKPFEHLIEKLKEIQDNFGSKYKFKYQFEGEIKNRICGLGNNGFNAWKGECDKINGNNYDNNKFNLDTISGRVNFMYQKTLGAAPDAKSRLDELKEIWHHDIDLLLEVYQDLIICLTNVVMAKKDYKYSHNTFLHDLNGLYQEYISSSHIIATLNAGNKQYVFSHGGMPKVLYSFGFDPAYINHNVNVKSIDDTKKSVNIDKTNFNNLDASDFKEVTNLEIMISAINRDVDMLISSLAESNLMNFRSNPIIDKFIYLTAGDGNAHIGCSYSPVGWIQWGKKGSALTDDNNFIKIQSGVQDGGKVNWWNQMDQILYMDMSKYYTNLKKSGKELYILFGHLPQGVAPTIWKKDDSPYYVCMDVSKAEGNFAQSSYAVYSIKNGDDNDDVIIGNTYFIKGNDTRIYLTDNENDLSKDLINNPINMAYTIDINVVKFDTQMNGENKLPYKMSINYKEKKYHVYAGTFPTKDTPPKFLTYCKFVESGSADKDVKMGNFFFELYRKNKKAYAKI